MGDVAGESVILVRAAEALHAFYNVCQHRGAELRPVGGEVDVVTNDGVVHCIWMDDPSF